MTPKMMDIHQILISLFSFSVGASFKPIHDEASNSTSSCPQTSTATEATTVVTSHPDTDHQSKSPAAPSVAVSGLTSATENSQQDSSNPEPSTTTTENTPVKTNTSAASKAAAFFTSGKMSSSSTDLKKSKASPVEGSDCKFNTLTQYLDT